MQTNHLENIGVHGAGALATAAVIHLRHTQTHGDQRNTQHQRGSTY